MRRIVLCCLLALGATSACAAGYDDFARGLAALNRNDNEAAISNFTAALAAGDLSPNLMPSAYTGRARAHLRKNDCMMAVSDAGDALKVDSDYVEAYLVQGNAEICVGDNASAISDFTRAAGLRESEDVYWGRGRARWAIGDFANAAADFTIASALGPNHPYPLLWLAVARSRAGTFDRVQMAKNIDRLGLTSWPKPIMDLYTGAGNLDDVGRFAGTGDEKAVSAKKCEAHFYVAEWWLAQSNTNAAKALLEDARANCPHDYVEYPAAVAELKRLP